MSSRHCCPEPRGAPRGPSSVAGRAATLGAQRQNEGGLGTARLRRLSLSSPDCLVSELDPPCVAKGVELMARACSSAAGPQGVTITVSAQAELVSGVFR